MLRNVSQLLCVLLAASTGGCSFLLDFEELRAGADEPGQDASVSVDDAVTDDEVTDEDETDELSDDEVTDEQSTDETDDSTADDPTADAAAPVILEAGACGDCEDDDPCTEDLCTTEGCLNRPMVCESDDSCVQSSCVDGACVEQPITGLVADGLDATVQADRIYRSELIGVGDRFYQVTYGVWEGKPDVSLTSFDRSTEAVIDEAWLSDALPQSVVVASPAAIVADTRLGLQLFVYAAIRGVGQAPGTAGMVVRAMLNHDLEFIDDQAVGVSTSANYRFVSERIGPAAAQPTDADPFVIYNGCTTEEGADGPTCVSTEMAGGAGGLYVQIGDSVLDVASPGTNFFPESRELSGLGALTAGSTPGAMWMANEPSGGVTLRTQFTDGMQATPLAQCHPDAAFRGYAMDVTRSLSGIWTTTWSKRTGSTFASEVTALLCQDGGCADLTVPPQATQCPDPAPAGRVLADVSNVVTRALRRPDDPPQRIYQAAAAATSSDSEAALAVLVNRLDFDLDGTGGGEDPVNLGALSLDSDAPSSAPGWPSLATLSPDRLAVSWIRAGQSSQPDELRVQRYRICFGE